MAAYCDCAGQSQSCRWPVVGGSIADWDWRLAVSFTYASLLLLSLSLAPVLCPVFRSGSFRILYFVCIIFFDIDMGLMDAGFF
jgi:hypothetical protein